MRLRTPDGTIDQKAETVPATGQFDIILANIKDVILEHLTGFKEILADDGILFIERTADWRWKGHKGKKQLHWL